MDKTGRSRRDCLYHIAHVNMAFSECEEMLTSTLNLVQLLPECLLDAILADLDRVLQSPGRNGQLELVHCVVQRTVGMLQPAQSLGAGPSGSVGGSDRSWGDWFSSIWVADAPGQPKTVVETNREKYADFGTHVRMAKKDLEVMFGWSARQLGYSSHDDHEDSTNVSESLATGAKIMLGDLENISKEGWLLKQGHTIRNWKRRYCTISSHDGMQFLHYYTDNDDDDMTPSGMIPLKNVTVRPSLALKYAFEIVNVEASVHSHDYYLLRAKTAQIQEEWMAKIQKAAESSIPQSVSEVERCKQAYIILMGDARHPATGTPMRADRQYKKTMYTGCFDGKELADFFIDHELITTCENREQAIAFGTALVKQGLLKSSANAADSSFHDATMPYRLVVSLDGVDPDCQRVAGEIKQLSTDWQRLQIMSTLIRTVLQPLDCSMAAGQEFWKVFTKAAAANPVRQFDDVMRYLASLQAGDNAIGTNKAELCRAFTEMFIRQCCFKLQTPRLSFLRFAVMLVGYDSYAVWKAEIDKVFRGQGQDGLTAGMRVWMTGAMLQLSTPRLDCPVNRLIESHLQTVYSQTGSVDNTFSEMIVQTFEDELLEDIRVANDSDYTGLISKATEALETIRRGIPAPDSDGGTMGAALAHSARVGPTFTFSRGSGTTFPLLEWLIAVATVRVLIGTVAEKICERSHTEVPALCEICSEILVSGVVEGQPRPLQLYLMKCFERRVGMQQTLGLLNDATLVVPGTPSHAVLQCGALRDEVMQYSSASACTPAADPFTFIFEPEGYSVFTRAVQQSVLYGIKTKKEHLDKAAQYLKRNSKRAPEVFTLSMFHEVFALFGGHDGQTGKTGKLFDVEWISKSLEKAGLDITEQFASTCELLEKMARNAFDAASIFCMRPTSVLDDVLLVRPLMHMASYALKSDTFFGKLLLRPGKFSKLLMPTMPEDMLAEILKTQGDVGIYKCPNGHPYLVGQCTRPSQKATCFCGASIGNAKGKSAHTMAGGNHFMGWSKQGAGRMTDYRGRGQMTDEKGNRVDMASVAVRGGQAAVYEGNAETGYAGGDYTTQSDKMESVRQLTPTAFRMLRFFMHGTMELSVAADFTRETGKSSRASAAKLKNLTNVGRNFWSDHVKNDFTQLKALTGQSTEDLSLLLHLLVEECFSNREPAGLYYNDDQSRLTFEHWFKQRVTAATTDFEQKCRAVKVGSQEEGSQRTAFLQEITETYPLELIDRKLDTPLLLRSRKPVSVQLMVNSFQMNTMLQAQYPIINSFVKPDNSSSLVELRVLHHVYHIYRWQTLVYNKFNRRINRVDARQLTVKEVINSLPQEQRPEWREAWRLHVSAWNAIQPFIKNYECHAHVLPKLHGAFEGVVRDANEITDDLDVPIDLSMPNSSNDEWVNSIQPVVLQQWAIRITNALVEGCRKALITRAELAGQGGTVTLHRTLSTSTGTAGRIMQQAAPRPIFMLRQSDFVHYDQEALESFLRANAGQSLAYGEGMKLLWDWIAIENWIVENVIEGIPLLQEGMRIFEFQGEVEDARGANVVGNIEQVELQESVRALIMQQQSSLQKMRRLQERLQECIGFARSTGGDGDELVGTYVQRTLQLDEKEMQDLHAGDGTAGAVLSSVRLKHLLSLEKMLTRRMLIEVSGPS